MNERTRPVHFPEKQAEAADQSGELAAGHESGGPQEGQAPVKTDPRKKALNWVVAILAVTALAGLFVRFKPSRKLRGVFLLASLVVLGFYKGGCPCMISSFINTVLWSFGAERHWSLFIWFLGLIPITYLFGRVWCGWICHLGAVQEFIFSGSKFRALKSESAQKAMKILQYFLLATLLMQLFITKTNIWCRIDPFLVGFSLMSGAKISLILLALMLLSSIFIHRPFCRAACPIGLILGWVSRIPGASILEDKSECITCSICSETCLSQAIQRKKEGDNFSLLFDNRECNACGECLSLCDKDAIKFTRQKINKTPWKKLFRIFKKS